MATFMSERAWSDLGEGRGAKALICLVHGTFASGAPWTRSDSAFCGALRRTLPDAEILAFDWSGGNDHEVRLDAAKRLAAAVEAKLSSGAVSRVYFIGHSHGGNVALMALRSAVVAEGVRAIAFLGTPFLYAQPRSWSGSIQSLTKILSYAVPTVLATALIGLFAIFIAPGLSLAWAPIVGVAVLVIVLGKTEDIQAWMQDLLEVEFETRVKAAGRDMDDLTRFPTPPCPTFVATVAGDEAGLLLDSVDKISSPPLHILRLVGESLKSAFIGCMATMLVLSVIDERSLDDSSNVIVVGSFLLVVALAFAILLLPVALLTSLFRGSRLAFGGESPMMVMAARVRTSAVPAWNDASGSIRRGWSRDVASGLRHSFFYASPEVIEAVVDWIGDLDRGRSLPRSAATALSGADLGASPKPWQARWLPGALISVAMVLASLA